MEKKIDEKKLNLACGQNKIEGFFGIDIADTDAADAIMDLEKYPWNIESESAEEIVCNHYVEHVDDLIKFMDECYRILKTDGKLRIVAPYYTSIRCWQDPTHKRAISEASFFYYNKEWRDTNKLDHYKIKSDFNFEYGYNIDTEWTSRNTEQRDFAIKHYWNVVSDIIVTLTKK